MKKSIYQIFTDHFFTVEQIELRPYQVELAQPGLEGKNCIILAPTGNASYRQRVLHLELKYTWRIPLALEISGNYFHVFPHR